MYADNITGSMKRAIAEVDRRREVQHKYNLEHGLSPVQIVKPLREKLIEDLPEDETEKKRKEIFKEIDYKSLPPDELKKEIKKMEKAMIYEAEILAFEKAAVLRDKVRELKRLV